MKLYRTTAGNLLEAENQFYLFPGDWNQLINRDSLHQHLLEFANPRHIVNQTPSEFEILVPAIGQEIWAAGVTYLRSRDARMDESKTSGGATFYDKVYDAERPELFFKAMPYRTAAHKQPVYIRSDSTWNVPEPEITLFINSDGKIQGYTIGNDMSSRSIEGENPLYLPQAKTYDFSAAIGPCIYIPPHTIAEDTRIHLSILRNDETVFSDSISISRIKRSFVELVSFLFRECSFAHGCFLMTGTGIVPPDTFTLAAGDIVQISIDGIGMLENYVSHSRQN